MTAKAEDKSRKSRPEMIWGNLVHLSFNMWYERHDPVADKAYCCAKPYLRFHETLWRDLLREMAEAGMNMVVIDLGDAVRYKSHPEIAVRRAWAPAKLRRELDRARKLGIEPIPKLNFSACHDAWLGKYSRCLSTDLYYGVCRDLIEEVCEIFDRPRLFQLGMDEEVHRFQEGMYMSVVRQHELWWHDLYYLADQVERHGGRAWVWSDYLWNHPDVFFRKMPKSIVQSNWYYRPSFSRKVPAVKAYLDLEAHGYDQIPTGSNHRCPENFPKTVAFCRKYIAPKRLLGFLQTTWRPTMNPCRDRHLEAIEAVAQGRKKWSNEG